MKNRAYCVVNYTSFSGFLYSGSMQNFRALGVIFNYDFLMIFFSSSVDGSHKIFSEFNWKKKKVKELHDRYPKFSISFRGVPDRLRPVHRLLNICELRYQNPHLQETSFIFWVVFGCVIPRPKYNLLSTYEVGPEPLSSWQRPPLETSRSNFSPQ